MEKKLYKLIKETEPMTIYIGTTKSSLKNRLTSHKASQKYGCSMPVYNWFDNTVSIELIDIVYGDTQVDFENIEYECIKNFKDKGFTILNYKDGRSKVEDYEKIKSERKKVSGKRKEYSSNRDSNYTNWQNKICRLAKKENLSSKEYRAKYNIPDYQENKKIN